MSKYPIFLKDGNTVIVSNTIDLHYSPDENAWYFQDYDRNVNSTLYCSRDEALYRFANNKVEWKERE